MVALATDEIAIRRHHQVVSAQVHLLVALAAVDMNNGTGDRFAHLGPVVLEGTPMHFQKCGRFVRGRGAGWIDLGGNWIDPSGAVRRFRAGIRGRPRR